MKGVAVIIMTAFLLVLISAPWIVKGDERRTDLELRQQYENLIEKCIDCCLAKAKFLDSRSIAIQKDALKSIVKGAYIHNNKDSLLKGLIAADIKPHHCVVKCHLNIKFFQTYKKDIISSIFQSSTNNEL